ncbi:MAG: aquaporin family protein [Rhodospirillaceae bacterium]|nr:aquaporin family protein [Rhodospirillaceae bacterium]
MPDLSRRLAAEAIGSAFLLATVIGSGIMGEALAGGNAALALLGNTAATGAILYVLIVQLGPVSGAHFNPAVTLVSAMRREIGWSEGAAYSAAQLVGAVAGVLAAHAMFDQPLMQAATKIRTGPGQWFAEWVATFGLALVVLMTRQAVAASVALYITAAYWFTASTSFANPAVTLARSLSDSFAGIRPVDAPGFVAAQVVGALSALVVARWFRASSRA